LNVIASLDSGAIVATTDWMQVTDRRTAPAGTGFIRVRLIATRANGTSNDAFFDNVVLRALDGVGVKLRGIISDDGLPAGSTITTNWTPQAVTGNVVFADAANPVTTAVFDTQPSTSQSVIFDDLRLSASDSELTGIATKSFRIMRANQTPAPNAGENQSVTLPGTANLSGSVADDSYFIVINGNPISRPLTSAWLKVSGPGSVT
jgi:hypothetical protein